MKRFVLSAVAVLSLVLTAGVAAVLLAPTFEEVQSSVRPVTATTGEIWCSAVAIRPGVALTAKHCLFDGMLVDGLAVQWVETTSDPARDIAIVYVQGLACPCAELGDRPVVGDSAVAVGYPGSQTPNRVVTPVVDVTHVGTLREIAGWMDESYLQSDFILTGPVLSPGFSGGGLFAVQGGRWKLVGINVIGVPDQSSCVPFFGCSVFIASGYTPLDTAVFEARKG